MKTNTIILIIGIILLVFGPPFVHESCSKRIEYETVTFGKCQYIKSNFNSAVLTHKEDCNNPIHKCPCDTLKIK